MSTAIRGEAGRPTTRSGIGGRIVAVIGPLLVAAAVWCAAGTVTVAGVDDTTTRLVVPASPWWFVAALVVALAVPAWRRPVLASPALLAVLPWLPLPVPPVVLVWSGLIAWVPVGLAVVAAVCGGRQAPAGDAPDVVALSRVRRPLAAALLAGVLTACASGLVWWSIHPRLPGGDEPHYLVITQSLLKDGDLRIENNHLDGDYKAYFPGTIGPDYVQRGQDGEIYSIHAPGVSVLVAPGFAAFGLRGAQATMILLAAVTGGLVWLLGWVVTGDRAAAWFAWATVAGSTTFLVQSVTIFPDGAGAPIAAAAALLWLHIARRDGVRTIWLVVVSGLLAALPFLHTRFVILAAGFGLAILYGLWRDQTIDAAVRLRRVMAFLALPLVGACAWFAYFWIIYGTPDPVAPYGTGAETRLAYIPGGLTGLLFDQQFGVFAYTPALVVAMAGWIASARFRTARPLVALAAIAFAYGAAVSAYWMWWAGVPAIPARLLTSVLPLMAAPAAFGWLRFGRAARAASTVLLGVSLATSGLVLLTGEGGLAWNVRGGSAAWLTRLESLANLPRGWPSFFWDLTPAVVRSEAPFAQHVLVWVAAFALVAVLMQAAVRRAGAAATIGCGVWWWPLGLMLAVSGGWWLSDAPSLAPAQSQLAVLRALAGGAPVYRVAPLAVGAVPAGTIPLRITVPRVDLAGARTVEWGGLSGVPAGRYDFRFSARRPTGGTLVVRAGTSGVPLTTIELQRLSEQTVGVDLAGDVPSLRFVVDEALGAGGRRLDLIPRALGRAGAPHGQ